LNEGKESAATPQTYREKHRDNTSLSKQRRPGAKKIQKGIQQQLDYVHRYIKHVTRLAQKQVFKLLVTRDTKIFW